MWQGTVNVRKDEFNWSLRCGGLLRRRRFPWVPWGLSKSVTFVQKLEVKFISASSPSKATTTEKKVTVVLTVKRMVKGNWERRAELASLRRLVWP